MIHWQTVKEFFGFDTKTEPDTVKPLTEGKTKSPIQLQTTTQRPKAGPPPKRWQINARNYYRRSGRYYSRDDNGLVEDVLLLVALGDLYDAGEIFEQEAQSEHWNTINSETDDVEEPTEDLLDIDVSETPVVESVGNYGNYTAPETPSYSAPDPEPVRQESYSSSDSSSSYDSGSSDCETGGDCD